jgi:hypothetical protein
MLKRAEALPKVKEWCVRVRFPSSFLFFPSSGSSFFGE